MTEQPSTSLHREETILSAWNSQLAEAARIPLLSRLFTQCGNELFPRFATSYDQLRSLPRRARRALQRRLARSRELTHMVPERMPRQARRSLQHKLAWSLAGAALLLALGQGVQAATITVDTRNANINSLDGKCSLSEAIINANNDAATYAECAAGSGTDTIQMLAGTHTVSAPYNNYAALPPITSAIIIQGNGAKIVRKNTAVSARVISTTTSGDLTLNNVTVSGGVYSGRGGGIYNQGILTVTNSTISGNRAASGGGIFNYAGTLTIQNSTIRKNSAYSGGGIADYGGTATIDNSTISKNTIKYLYSTSTGGAIITGSGSDVTVTNSTITGNKAGSRRDSGALGAGVANGTGGILNIQNSTISKNTVTASSYYAVGAGIINRGTLTIDNSTIETGKAKFGAGLHNTGTATVQNSTISQNAARSTQYFTAGGGILNMGTLTLTNSTLSGNSADVGGGAGNAYGTAYLFNTTLTKNRSRFAGGGIVNAGSLILSRTLISGNVTPASGIAPQIFHYSGGVTAFDYNLFGANGNPGTYGVSYGGSDIVPAAGVTTAQVLSPSLRDNGGPTKTHALVAGSPAIDAAPCILATDQRGVARVPGAGGLCDIGAFEGPP